MPKRDQRECLHCKELFLPDRRNRWHQKFCLKPECRRASKARSQSQWLSKPENRDVFGGSANVERVRQWRARHPGYWKRPAQKSSTLQAVILPQPPEDKALPETTSRSPLQDVLESQAALLLGLIAHLIDSPLQENVVKAALGLLEKGRIILDVLSGMQPKGNTYADQKTSAVSGTTSPSAGTV